MSSSTQSNKLHPPPPGLAKLIKVVQNKYPGFTSEDAIKAIVSVKEQNGGALKGLSIIKFHKLLKLVVTKKIELKKKEEKEEKEKNKRLRKTCLVCYRIFSTNQALEKHAIIHEKKKHLKIDQEIPVINKDLIGYEERLESETIDETKTSHRWKCKECEKEFKHKVSLDRHTQEAHVKDKQFACSVCDFKFSREDNLYAHRRNVHNTHRLNLDAIRSLANDNLLCKICDEKFESIKKFEAHIALKICQDEKNNLDINEEEKYQCHLCDRSYDHKKNLLAHFNWKHKEKKSYRCEICDVSFSQKSSLERHNRKSHSSLTKPM